MALGNKYGRETQEMNSLSSEERQYLSIGVNHKGLKLGFFKRWNLAILFCNVIAAFQSLAGHTKIFNSGI